MRKLRTEKDIEKSITCLDIEKEMYLADRFRFHQKNGKVIPLPISKFGSFLTGTGTELIYSNPTVGTAKTTFTTEFMINDTAGMGPAPVLPAWFFMPSRSRSQAIRIVARGITSVTATPTWIWTFRLNPVVTPAVPPTGPNVGSTGTLTALTGVTNQLWEAELDVQLTLEGAAGSNSTVRGLGRLLAPGLFTTVAGMAIFGSGASPGTVATVDISLLNTLTVGSTCGTSSASNSIQLLQLLVFGLN